MNSNAENEPLQMNYAIEDIPLPAVLVRAFDLLYALGAALSTACSSDGGNYDR